MKTLLLTYTPPMYRADLDCNDGFDPHDPDSMIDNPERGLRYQCAEDAMKAGMGMAVDDFIAYKVLCSAGGVIDDLSCYLDLITDLNMQAETARKVKRYAAEIIRDADKHLARIKKAKRHRRIIHRVSEKYFNEEVA